MEQETPCTVKEVAELTGFSPQTVTKMFENEPGVIVYEEKKSRKRASYGLFASHALFTGV